MDRGWHRDQASWEHKSRDSSQTVTGKDTLRESRSRHSLPCRCGPLQLLNRTRPAGPPGEPRTQVHVHQRLRPRRWPRTRSPGPAPGPPASFPSLQFRASSHRWSTVARPGLGGAVGWAAGWSAHLWGTPAGRSQSPAKGQTPAMGRFSAAFREIWLEGHSWWLVHSHRLPCGCGSQPCWGHSRVPCGILGTEHGQSPSSRVRPFLAEMPIPHSSTSQG